MSTFVICAWMILVGLNIFFFLMWRIARIEKKQTEEEFNRFVDKYEEMEKTISLLQSELRIKSENRKKADEKIEALHNGNVVDNAINGLSKH